MIRRSMSSARGEPPGFSLLDFMLYSLLCNKLSPTLSRAQGEHANPRRSHPGRFQSHPNPSQSVFASCLHRLGT
uniref:Secreted protein n=1 Tax=Steinernema glaseri TaxID=37863 RepID=A0A1I7XXJ7_9BILA